MLRFRESNTHFKDGMYILFHQNIGGWLFDFVMLLLLAGLVWLCVKFVREKETFMKIGLVFFSAFAILIVLLIKPMTVLMGNVGHYEGDFKVDSTKISKSNGENVGVLLDKKSEVRSPYMIVVPKSKIDKKEIKKGDTVYLKTKPLVEKKQKSQIFDTRQSNIEFKVK